MKLSGRKTVRLAYLVLAFAGGLGLVRVAWPVLSPFVFAAVLSYLLAPLVQWFENRRVRRVVAVLAAYVLAFGAASLAIVYLFPLAVQQTVSLARVFPVLVQEGQSLWNTVLMRFHETPLPDPVRRALGDAASRWERHGVDVVRHSLTFVMSLVPGVLAVLVSPILAFYALTDLPRMKRGFWALIPVAWQPAVYKLGVDLDYTLASYIRGQLLVAMAVGVMSAGLTAALGIPFAVLVGILAGLTDIIPYVGPVVGALPAVLLGVVRSPWVGLYAVIGFAAIHQLEGMVLAPLVVGDAVGLHPLLIVLAILIGGEVAGLSGMLVAVPTAAALKVVMVHLYRRLSQAEHSSVPGGGHTVHPDQSPKVR